MKMITTTDIVANVSKKPFHVASLLEEIGDYNQKQAREK
jgi:hypothetical protein